jgi:RNA polymerase sigma-70 factor, ECF subfamily
MSHAADEDQELLTLARGGDFDAFEGLVYRYEHRIYGLAMRMVGRREDAEEVVQQTFLSLLEHLDDFRGQSRFSTWLTRIATNHALLLLRRRARHPTVPLPAEASGAYDESQGIPQPHFVAPWQAPPEQIAARRETRQLLAHVLEELDEKYRVVFLLRDLEGLSTAETAAALGISEANVKVRLLRARLMLRERLTREFGNEAVALLDKTT